MSLNCRANLWYSIERRREGGRERGREGERERKRERESEMQNRAYFLNRRRFPVRSISAPSSPRFRPPVKKELSQLQSGDYVILDIFIVHLKEDALESTA